MRGRLPAVVVSVGLLSAACASGAAGGGTPATNASPRSGGAATTGGASTPASSSPTAPPTEFSPPGDIPDTQVFVDYSPPGACVHVKVPEGWARTVRAGTTVFADKYNSVSIAVRRRPTAPTVASAKRQDLPALRRSEVKFAAGTVSTFTRRNGSGVLVTYQVDSAPNQVTGKVVRDAVQRYLFWRAGQEAVLTLSGPRNADNVDPWRIVSDSLRWG